VLEGEGDYYTQIARRILLLPYSVQLVNEILNRNRNIHMHKKCNSANRRPRPTTELRELLELHEDKEVANSECGQGSS
jgi:hypothetical protein